MDEETLRHCKFRFIRKDMEIAHVDMNYQDYYKW